MQRQPERVRDAPAAAAVLALRLMDVQEMTLILQRLSDLTPFLSARSNAALPPGRQAAVICCPSETRSPDTSIMDPYVLLNKRRVQRRRGSEVALFECGAAGPRRSSADGRRSRADGD